MRDELGVVTVKQAVIMNVLYVRLRHSGSNMELKRRLK
jgi:hypothetical protein